MSLPHRIRVPVGGGGMSTLVAHKFQGEDQHGPCTESECGFYAEHPVHGRQVRHLVHDEVIPPAAVPAASNGQVSPIGGDSTLVPLDWPKLLDQGVPEIPFLKPPYLPRGARVLVAGAASVGKSLLIAAEAAEISRQGGTVTMVDQENPLPELLRRLERLRPDPARFEVFHFCGLDLANHAHGQELVAAAEGRDLFVVDTLSSCSTGDENDNAVFTALDRDVMQPIVAKGTTFVLIDYSGHPQQFVRRRGVSAPRGASSKAQKCDVVLEVRAAAEGFTIEHAKARIGGQLEPPTTFRFEDADDGSIQVVRVESVGVDLAAARERALALVEGRPDEFTKSSLAERLDMRRQDGLIVVAGLLEQGVIGPDRARARLRLLAGGSEGSEGAML